MREEGAKNLCRLLGGRRTKSEIDHARLPMLALPKHQRAKVAVEGDEEPILAVGPREHGGVGSAALVADRNNVMSVGTKRVDTRARNILIGEQFHSPLFPHATPRRR